MSEFIIKKEILIDAPPESVFDALTDSEKIVEYFPLREVNSKWKVGSEVHYKGEVDGSEFTDYGTIDELNRPLKYKYTYWSDNHGTERVPENHLSICYQLSREGSGTRLRVEQSNIKIKEMYDQMNSHVWAYLLERLKEYVESHT